MAINTFLSCPEDCDTDVLLPAISQDQDCTTWIPKDSQVGDLFIFPRLATLPDNWTEAGDWQFLLNNLDITNTTGKWLVGMGGVDPVEIELTELPKKKARVSGRKYVLTFEIPNLGQLMYDFLRHFQCNWTDFVFFFRTVGGRLFGKDGGISPSFCDVDFPLEEPRDGTETAIVTIIFYADGAADRADGTDLIDVLDTMGPWIDPDGEPWVTPDGDWWIVPG